ncbi:MAG: lysylphosphatidylglycerol synthase transmembrane domain-containing protein [Planctomycetota bacterium]
MSDHRTHSPKRRLLFAAKAVASLAVLAYVLRSADLGLVLGRMREADPLYLGLALLTPFAGYAITSIRWSGLLRAAGASVPFARLYRACLTAVFFNQLLPSTVGGDVARVYAAWKSGAPRSVALSSLLVDRVIGVLAQVLVAAAVIPFLASSTLPTSVYVVVGGMALAVGTLVLAVFVPSSRPAALVLRVVGMVPGPFASIARKVEAGFASYRGRWGVLGRATLISLVMIANVVLMHWLIGRALGLDLSLTVYLFVIPVATIVMLVPISINGIGLREAIFALLLGAYGIGKADAVALSLLAFATFLSHGVLGGVLFAVARPSVPLSTSGDGPPTAAVEAKA